MGDLTMDFLRLMLMAAMLLTSLQGQAADAATAPAPTTHEVEFLRSADKAQFLKTTVPAWDAEAKAAGRLAQ